MSITFEYNPKLLKLTIHISTDSTFSFDHLVKFYERLIFNITEIRFN